MKKPRIRLLIVDDHYVVRMGLTGSVSMEPDMAVVAEASTGPQALELYRQHKPDVVLLDLRLPGMDGVETTAALCREFPAVRIIILSTYDGEEDIYRALHAGAQAYLLKTMPREELLEAIRVVYGGNRYIPPAVAARLADRLHRPELSAREREVLMHLAKGRSNKEIAFVLNITEVTVKLHVSNILGKLSVNDRTQAVTVALQRGIVRLE